MSDCVSETHDFAHDPLCPIMQPLYQGACGGECHCELIAKVREGEAEAQWENVEKGYFYGIALCIAAIDGAVDPLAAVRALMAE